MVYLDSDLTGVNGVATALSVLLNNTPGIPNAVLGYSAASGASLLAPASIGSIYGKNLAKVTAPSVDAMLQTQLGGISLRVRDGSNTVLLAPLYYVSPTQINFVVPAATSLGPVTLTVDDGSVPLVEDANATIVNDVAPSFFTANSQGQGAAAATAVRILADGSQQPVSVFNCTAPGQCTTVSIDLTSGQPVYLSLYGTGFRDTQKNNGVTQVNCQVGGTTAVIQYSGPQPTFTGLDQLNLLLPQSLPSGQAAIQCQFFGIYLSFASNTVQIAIK